MSVGHAYDFTTIDSFQRAHTHTHACTRTPFQSLSHNILTKSLLNNRNTLTHLQHIAWPQKHK